MKLRSRFLHSNTHQSEPRLPQLDSLCGLPFTENAVCTTFHYISATCSIYEESDIGLTQVHGPLLRKSHAFWELSGLFFISCYFKCINKVGYGFYVTMVPSTVKEL